MSKPHSNKDAHKRVRHTMRRFAMANGKRSYLFAAAAGK
jgi:hypothetical protein